MNDKKVKKVIILAIESSCDDTSAAIIIDGEIKSNRIANQSVHEQYGGVVPELASRAHMANIVPVVKSALVDAGVEQKDLTAIGFTRGPGLLGSLIVGVSFAKSLALSLNIPLLEVHHMNAHILAHFAEDPKPEDLFTHDFAPTPITEERGDRSPANGEEKVMVDSALLAVQELMEKHPECLLYGQDVGARLGGVFREAATLAQKFGDDRVFNTPIQEAFIIGSTVGMSAAGLRPIVEVQFADYIWPGLNQLFSEVSRSCYLSNGKFPISMILRVPIGAYGSGGPYHSSSVESVLTNIRGIKIAYPSNGADMKGLMKAAYYDPNPVVMLEHKGLYWSKVKGTDAARTIMPDKDYVLPFGIGNMVQESSEPNKKSGNNVLVIAYGMGVHWALNASKGLEGHIGILDLRTLYPLDEELIFEKSKVYGRILVVTEEPVNNGFAQSIASRIQQACFKQLDAPVTVIGAENMPAIPLNETLEKTMIPSAEKVRVAIESLLNY